MTKLVPSLALQFHQLELGLGAQFLVERGHRLVEQQHARALDQRARQRHPLALAAGKLVDAPLAIALQAHQRQHLRDPLGELSFACLLLAQTEGDVSLHAEVGKQRIALEHHVDRPAVRRHGDDVLAVEQDAAFARRLETGEHAQERGFAAAGGAEQREEFALLDVEREGFDRHHLAEALADRLEAHQRAPGLRLPLRGAAALRHRFPSPPQRAR